ncbi:MAG: SPFH domain-containing protein [Ruminococcus sp.]|nr:SPFH domain-containing protein [Ruminococcus sp.]
MGIIKAAINAVKGGLADSWLEVIESSPMGDNTLICPGQLISQNGKSQNKKGSNNIVSNGSVIHVQHDQMMILIDGGKIVDFTAEPGYFQVSNSSMPSLFCGQFGDSIKETFNRIKFGGIPSQSQRVFYINLQEIKGIPFGTPTPINYFDNFYNSELELRAHGTYSVKVVDPFKFYEEVIPREAITNNRAVEYSEVKAQYSEEFVSALGAAINQYSADGERISFIRSKQRLLGQYMAQTLDDEWTQNRGMEVFAVAADVSYTDDSQALINMRNKGAMMSDAAVQQGYVAANISEGLKDAGSNANGSMAGFMGMGVGMNVGGNIIGGYQQNPHYNNQQPNQGAPAPAPQGGPQTAPSANTWTCACGATNTGKFCPECGQPKPEAPKKRFCTNCGYELGENAKFCPECGTKAE